VRFWIKDDFVKGQRTTPKSKKTSNGEKPRVKIKYDQEVIPLLMKEFGYKNKLQVPRMEKIIVNIGMGEAIQNIKFLDSAVKELGQITGQRPIVTKARKSIAGFKLRSGMPIGCKVTLRGQRLYEFFDRLTHVALPRIRDFRGVSEKAFDGRGNFTLGIKEQLIFPEIKYDEIAMTHGMDITIVTTAKSDHEARALLKNLGIPFRNR
jgi:large subunit ribosomal protein L5